MTTALATRLLHPVSREIGCKPLTTTVGLTFRALIGTDGDTELKVAL